MPVANVGDLADDKQQHQQQAAKEESTKSVAHGLPEPGRDIFADKEKNDIKSEERKPKPKVEEEEKEEKLFVDTNVKKEEPTDAKKDESTDSKKDEPTGVEGEAKVISTAAPPPKIAEVIPEADVVVDNEGVDPVPEEKAAPEASEVTEVPGGKKAGPLVEDEAVADDVAKELYPEAADS